MQVFARFQGIFEMFSHVLAVGSALCHVYKVSDAPYPIALSPNDGA